MLVPLFGAVALAGAALLGREGGDQFGDMGSAESERARLGAELRKLKGRTAWSGVDRVYEEMVQLRIPLRADTHLVGSIAAGQIGRALEARQRAVWAMGTAPITPGSTEHQAQQAITFIDNTFGPVNLSTRKQLAPKMMPFGQREAKAVHYAAAQLKAKGDFRGLLPVGDYTLGKKTFSVSKAGASYGDSSNLSRQTPMATEMAPWGTSNPSFIAAQVFGIAAKNAGITTHPPKILGPNHTAVSVQPAQWLSYRDSHTQILGGTRKHGTSAFLVIRPDGATSVTFTTDPRGLKRMADTRGLAMLGI